MPRLAPDNAVLGDSAALRARAAEQGCLFLRALLPVEPLLELRQETLAICARHGWMTANAPWDEARAAPGIRWREGEAPYMAAYDEVQRLESFHRLAHQPQLLGVLEALFGEPVLVHPRNIARIMFPRNNRFTTPAHQDYVHIQGTADTWTAWIPLGDCPRSLGGLEVLPGSHRGGMLPVRAAYGAGGLGVDTEPLGLEWRGAAFRAGDVLLFHSLLVHRGVNNRSRDRLRLSLDYRYQPASHPVTEGSLLPHFNRLTWDEIYAGWPDSPLKYYWRRFQLRDAEYTRRWHEAAQPEA